MKVRHSGDPDVIECAMRDIPRIAVKVELRAMRLPPLTVRYVRFRAPDASRLSHTHCLKLSPYSVPCPPIIPTRTLSQTSRILPWRSGGSCREANKLKQSSWTSGFDSGISCEWPGFNPRGKPLGISGSIVG